jgi:uncharacterized protein
MKANRLIHSTSPYLLQHAHNPVDWFEWGTEALTKAKQEDKPILVSIGYSSCHWCHVMEHESFEDNDIASLMNEFFVCIKVDREERPDIDQVYMEAVQALGANGGWPLNVFLTPDQKPFFGGTYFSSAAWSQILINVNTAFKEKREQLSISANELTTHLATSEIARYQQANQWKELKEEIESSYRSIESKFDHIWGGVEKAPKFIMPSVWQWMLRYQYLTKNEAALTHTNLTLKKILQGGIYDQVGGGFARYSVDKEWFAPHFEKMLYDNAQLLSLYAEAYAITKDEDYRQAVYETFAWLQREMKHEQGVYYSALDADSEGEEGKFYVWTNQQLEDCLLEDSKLAQEYFECTEEGNWEHSNNILKRSSTLKIPKEKLAAIKQTLLNEREKRPRPGLDDKIITSWNAMTIIGLVDSYRYLQDEFFLKAAISSIQFIEKNLVEGDAIYRSFKGKRSNTEGFLDDYACLISAYTALHQATLDESYIEKAKRFTEITFLKFFDSSDGYFHYTSSSAEQLIARKKEVFDNVIPSSNSVMARNLLLVGSLVDIEEWKTIAERMVNNLSHVIRSEINYTGNWGMALMESQRSFTEVVLAGDSTEGFQKQLQQTYHPFNLYLKAVKGSVLPLTAQKVAINNQATIYVCVNKTCKLPVHSVEEALFILI